MSEIQAEGHSTPAQNPSSEPTTQEDRIDIGVNSQTTKGNETPSEAYASGSASGFASSNSDSNRVTSTENDEARSTGKKGGIA